MRLRIATAMLFVSFAVLLMPPLLARDRITLPTADSADVAAVAAQTLANSGSKESIPVLRRMLNHPSIIVRYYTAYGLGKLGDKESIKALQDSLWLKENDTPEDLLAPSMEEMKEFGGDYRLVYAYGGYRQMVCRALRQLGDTSVDKRFIEILEDQKADVKKRQEAYECLEQLGTEAAFNAMCKVAENDKVDFGAKVNWLSIMDNGLTREQRKKLSSLAAQNKNLPEEAHARYKSYLDSEPLSAKIEAAKTAEDIKKIFLEEQERNPQRLHSIVYHFAEYDLGDVEDWILKYIMDYYSKNKKGEWKETLSDQMLSVLSVKGTEKSLPVLEGLLQDKELALDVKNEAVMALNVIGRRINPGGSYLVLDRTNAGDMQWILENRPDDSALFLEGYKSPRAESAKRMLEFLRKPLEHANSSCYIALPNTYIDTLMAWKSSELVDIAVSWLEKDKTPEDAWNDSWYVDEALRILRLMDKKDKLPEIAKFYEGTHHDIDGNVTYTMYLFGDKEVPKRLLAEAQAYEQEKSPNKYFDYLRLLMYDDADCQKFFFDAPMKDTPRLDEMLCGALSGFYIDRKKYEYPINFQLAVPAFEKILMTSKKNYTRASIIQQIAKYAEKEVEVLKVLERFAAHSMDVCDQARKLIPQLGDKNFDVRKKTREELQKLGVDAVPAFEEWQKYVDPEIQQALKELAESYKDYNTGY